MANKKLEEWERQAYRTTGGLGAGFYHDAQGNPYQETRTADGRTEYKRLDVERAPSVDTWDYYVRQRQAQQRREEVAGQINSYFSVHGPGTNGGSPFARFAPGAQAARTQTDTSGVMDFKALDEKARAAQKEQRRVDREKAQRDYEEALQAYNKARENTRRVSSVAGSVGPETRHRIDEARREETAAKERMDGLKQALDGLPSEENGITQWEGREELVKEYKRIQRLMESAVGRDNPASLARYQKYGEQLEEVRQKIEEGDRAAGNSPSDYSGADRFGSVLGSWGKSIAGGAMNALLTAADMAGKGYAQGYDTNRVLLDWMQGADSMEQWRQQAKGYESQENRDFWGKLYAAADSISDSAAADLDRAKNGLGRLGQAGLDIAKNVMEVGFDAGISAMTGIPALGVMATRVFGDSARDARRQGATLEQQVGYAAASAGIEVLTEKFADGLAGIYGKGAADNISETVIRRLSNTEAGATFLRILMGMNSEGLEEVASDLLHPFAERIYNADVFKDGYRANIDPAEMLYDYLLGGAVGALFGGAGAVAGGGAANAENAYLTEMYQQRGEKPGFFREVRDRAILERQAEEPGAYRTESMSAGENAQEAMKALRGRQTESQRAQELQQTQKAMASEGMGEMIRAVFSDDGVTLSDGEVKTLTEKAEEGEAGIRETVLGYREAYRMGENGDAWENVVENVGKRYGLTPSQITYAWGYGRNTQTTESGTADISTEEGRTKAESRLAIFGERAQEALELMQPRQDVGRYASALNKAAYLYAANGVDVQQMAEQARSGKAADIVGYLTAEQAALAQKIGEEQRQQVRKSVKAMSEARATMRQKAAALTQGQTVTAETLEQVDSALADARARVQEAQKAYADNMAKLDAMQRLSPKEWETEAFQTAYNEAVDKASAAKEAIQQTEAEIRELSKKKAEAEGKKVIQRKKGTVSFGGGTVEGRRFEGVERDKLSRQQKKVVAMVESLADTINLDYVFFSGEAGAGGAYVQGGTVFVNVNAGLGVGGFSQTMAAASLSHELTHWLQEYAPEEYQNLKDFVISEVLKAGPQKLNELVRQQRAWEADRNLSYDAALDEVVANACQTMLLDSKAITELARQHMSTAQKIADYISEWTQKVKDAFAEVDTSQGAIYDSLRAVQGGLDRMQELWDEGIRAASANYDAEQTAREANMPAQQKNAAQRMGDVKYQIIADMSEEERYAELKDKHITIRPTTRNAEHTESLNELEGIDRARSKAEKVLIPLAEKLGILNRTMTSPDVDIEFTFSKNKGLLESTQKQLRYGGSYQDFAKALIHIDQILQDAVLVEKHTDKYKGTAREDGSLQNVSVLFGAFRDGRFVIPVQFEIKKSSNYGGRLYMTVAMTKIRADVLGRAIKDSSTHPSLVSAHGYMIADIFKEIKPEDRHFLKYLPDQFLSEEQKTAKREAIEEDQRRIAAYKPKAETQGSTENKSPQYQQWDDTSGDTAAESNGREDAYARIEAESKAVSDTVAALRKLTEEQQGTIARLQRRIGYRTTPEALTEDARKMARRMLREYHSRADAENVTQDLKALGDYILQTKELDENEVRNRARAIAAEIVDQAREKVDVEDQTLTEIAERVKGKKLMIDPKFTGELDAEGGFQTFARRSRGLFILASKESRSIDRSEYTSVSRMYTDLQNDYGKAYFPDLANEGEEIAAIARTMRAAEPMEVNPFTQYMGEAVEALTNKIAMEAMGGAMQPVNDAYLAKGTAEALREQVRRLERDKTLGEGDAEALEKTITRLMKDMEIAGRRYRSLQVTADKRLEQVRAEGVARQVRAEAREKKRDEKLKKVKERYKDLEQWAEARRIESAMTTRYRNSINEKAGKLSNLIEHSNARQNVPEELRGPLKELLEAVEIVTRGEPRKGTGDTEGKDAGDTEGKKSGKLTREELEWQRWESADRNFGVLVTRLSEAIDEQESLGSLFDVSAEIRAFLHRLSAEAAKDGRGLSFSELLPQELKEFNRFLNNMSKAIDNMNSFMVNDKFVKVQDAAKADIAFMEELGRKSEFEGGRLLGALAWKNCTPYYAMRRFGEGGRAVFEALSKGWERMAFNVREVIAFTEKTYTPREAQAWRKETHTIRLEDGGEITMTTAQIMELSMLLGREQALRHMEKGGVRIGDVETKKGVRDDTEKYHLSVVDLQAITGLLTERQARVARTLQRYMARTGAEWGNEISLKRWGYAFYDEGPDYYPIKTSSTERPMADTDAQENSMFRLLNISASKAIDPKATNALVVGDIFDTFADHMADMAKLNGMGLPVLDAIKWFSYVEREELEDGQFRTRTTQDAIKRAFGNEAISYFKTLMKDINGTTENGDRGTGMLGRAMSSYKAAAVAANLRVALLQPTSYVRASYLIKPKYLAMAFASKNAYRAAYREMMQYSGTGVWKDVGGVDTNLKRGMRDQIRHDEGWKDGLVEKSMYLAELGDKATWAQLWAACRMQTQAGSGKTGAELMKATADLFREVIYATQVMDATLTRSEIMRGTTMKSKAMSAFMAEPTLSYSMVLDAAMETRMNLRRYGKEEGWKKSAGYLARAISVYLCSAAASAFVESIVDAFRDDDEYEKFWRDKFLQAFWGEGGPLSGNLVQDLTVVGKLPFAKKIMNKLQGYKDKDMSSAAIDDAFEAWKIWKETLQLNYEQLPEIVRRAMDRAGIEPLDRATKITYYGNMTTWGKIYKSLQVLSEATGIGAANLTRDVAALYNTFVAPHTGKKIKTYDAGPKKDIQEAYRNGRMDEETATGLLLEKEIAKDENDAYWMVRGFEGEDKYTQIKAAALSGEDGAFRHEMEQLTSHGVSEKEARSKVKAFIKAAYTGGELTAAERRALGGRKVTEDTAREVLTKYAGLDEDTAFLTVKGWESGESGRYTGALRAAFTGDRAGFRNELKALTEHGVKEKEVYDSVKSFVHDLYFGKELSAEQREIAGDAGITDAEARRLLNEYAGMSVNKAVETVSEWVRERSFFEKNGWYYADRKTRYVDGEITKEELRRALMSFGKLERSQADAQILEYDYDRVTGFAWSERKADYQRGDISRAEMAGYLVKYGGKSRDEALKQIAQWEWQRDVKGAENISVEQVEKYESYCAKAGVGKETFVQALAIYRDTAADVDEDGKTVKNSKTEKVMAKLGALPIGAGQKEALALCFYSESTVDKYRVW